MGSKQGAETRIINDMLRRLEDETFNNLGFEENEEEMKKQIQSLDITYKQSKPKRKTDFYTRFNELIKGKKINKSKLGREIAEYNGKEKPIARQTIDNYINGRTSPDIDTVIFLCQKFGCTPNYLLGFDNNITLEDSYISAELGLSQESINCLRTTAKKSATKYVSGAINILLNDFSVYAKELRDKKSGNAPSVNKGKNVLYYLYRYLSIELTTLKYLENEDWQKLKSEIVSLIQELDLDTADQKISYYREKVESLQQTYKQITLYNFTDTARTSAYFQALENSLKGLRRVLIQKDGQ